MNLWTYVGVSVNLWTCEPMNLFGVPVNLWNREPMNLLGVPANLWTYEPIGGSQWTYEPMKLFGGASESWNVWTYLGVLVESVWEDLGSQNGALLAPKFDHNSILCWKCCKANIAYKTNRILMIFEVEGVQVGSKNRWKIDPKRRSTWEGILASIFDRFLINFSIPRTSKIIKILLVL